MDFSKWLRQNYEFPILVQIYIKKCEKVQLANGMWTYGSFWYPNSLLIEPYIRIPTGDYLERVKERGQDAALEEILSSLVHELTHYFQWINQIDQSERSSEWQANYYRYRILDLYYK
ncbi:MAG: hypothetical protein PHV32_14325 [Eubacteriales bacterium]|nr:hypothetical protein [Eubacteriales bacterium]